MSKHKRRARVPQIPKPAPKKSAEVPISDTGKMLLQQVRSRHAELFEQHKAMVQQEISAVLGVLARESGIKGGAWDLDEERMVWKPRTAPAKKP